MPATKAVQPKATPPKFKAKSSLSGKRLDDLCQKLSLHLDDDDNFNDLQDPKSRMNLFYELLQYRHATSSSSSAPPSPYACETCFEKHLQEKYKIWSDYFYLVCLVEEWKATTTKVEAFIDEIEEGAALDWEQFTAEERNFVSRCWKRNSAPLCYGRRVRGECVDPRGTAEEDGSNA